MAFRDKKEYVTQVGIETEYGLYINREHFIN